VIKYIKNEQVIDKANNFNLCCMNITSSNKITAKRINSKGFMALLKAKVSLDRLLGST